MRAIPLLLFFLMMGSWILASESEAQVTQADSAAVLLQAAREFQAEGRIGVAEAIFHYITERFGDTPAGQLAQTALETPAEEGANRSSRVELQVWSTLYGAWLGVAIPTAFGAEKTGPYGAGLLLGTPGGFLAGRAIGRSRPLSEGQVRALTFGSLWGTWQGFGWAQVGDWGQNEICEFDYCYTDDPDGETLMKAMVVGGLAGTGIGWFIAQNPIPTGVASSANFGALWGSWVGVAGGILMDREGDGLLTTTLIGGNAGLITGAIFGSKLELSRNRSRLISIAGVVGGLGGAGLDLLLQPDDEKVAIAIPLVTSMAGLALGTALSSDSPSPGESRFGAGAEGLASESMDLALVEIRNGVLRAGVPSPFLTALPVETDSGMIWKPGLGLTLFSARFR
jgi:hypothetical protein